MDEKTEKAIRRFLSLLESEFPVEGAYLFGSRAHGSHSPDSDTDVAVLLGGGAPSIPAGEARDGERRLRHPDRYRRGHLAAAGVVEGVERPGRLPLAVVAAEHRLRRYPPLTNGHLAVRTLLDKADRALLSARLLLAMRSIVANDTGDPPPE